MGNPKNVPTKQGTGIMDNHRISDGNPRAVMARIERRNAGAYEGQRRHDMRQGAQPRYVDQTRGHLNAVIIEPPRPAILREINEGRRSQRETQRKMKSNATQAVIGIITLGSQAQIIFQDLTTEQQNAAFTDAAEDIAAHLETTLAGLVVHRDETSPHAHFTLPAYDTAGRPLSKTTTRDTLARIQDITAAAFQRYAPAIERGHRVSERAAAGAEFHDLRHRSVRELHADLPGELEAARKATKEAQERADEMAARVKKLEDKAELTKAEIKRLDTYRKRLETRAAEAEASRAEAQRIAEAVQRVAIKTKGEVIAARKEAADAKADALATREAAAADAATITAEATTLRDTLRTTIGAMKTLARRVGLTGLDAKTVALAITKAEEILRTPQPTPAPITKTEEGAGVSSSLGM